MPLFLAVLLHVLSPALIRKNAEDTDWMKMDVQTLPFVSTGITLAKLLVKYAAPTYCHPDEILCPGEVSVYSGCQMSYDYCLPAFKEGHKLGSMCEAFCKPQCNYDSPKYEKCCSGGFDENGCELPGWCAGVGEGCPHGYCLT